MFRSSSSGTRRERSERWSTSVATGARSSAKALASGLPSSVRTTRGRTASTEREGGIEREELCLVPLRLETWGPLVFVNPDDEAPPLAEILEDVPERIAAAGIDVNALRFLSRAESEIDANWKICAENFLECYHCPTAHPGFSAVMDVSPDSYLLETGAWRMTQHGPPRREPQGSYDPSGEVDGDSSTFSSRARSST